MKRGGVTPRNLFTRTGVSHREPKGETHASWTRPSKGFCSIGSRGKRILVLYIGKRGKVVVSRTPKKGASEKKKSRVD